MKNTVAASILGLLIAAACNGTWAHHNTRAQYDPDNPVTVQGKVVEFVMINPHSRIEVAVEDDQGHVENWLVEAGAASVMYRRGWRTDDLRPGVTVTATGWPAVDGSPEMSLIRLESEGGKVLEYR
jgi:hypothetical protein